ncbi:LPXTG cell wall anchor domain-containing protein [Enterococcus casseliflavus]|uniref:LPXTG cell wall anchor domain-containing protein n=1 Tax=Enterococcus casseliflavus TaxID=37734 RepID=UPI003D6A31E8
MKKIIFCIGLWCFLWFPLLISASDVGAYDSNGITSFFGVYEYPEEDEDALDVPPTEKPGNQQVNQVGNKILPATGSDHFSLYQSSGFVALLSAGFILIKRRKENENK